MNRLDCILGLVLVLCALGGAVIGISRIIFSFAAFCLGLAGGFAFCGQLSQYALPFVRAGIEKAAAKAGPLAALAMPHAEFLAKAIAFVAIFIVLFLVVKVFHALLSMALRGNIFEGLDRALGLLFGCAAGFVVMILILWAVKAQPFFDSQGLLQGSLLYRFLETSVFLPPPAVPGAMLRPGASPGVGLGIQGAARV